MSEAIDMSRFVEAKSDQLNADDLIGALAPRRLSIEATFNVRGGLTTVVRVEHPADPTGRGAG